VRGSSPRRRRPAFENSLRCAIRLRSGRTAADDGCSPLFKPGPLSFARFIQTAGRAARRPECVVRRGDACTGKSRRQYTIPTMITTALYASSARDSVRKSSLRSYSGKGTAPWDQHVASQRCDDDQPQVTNREKLLPEPTPSSCMFSRFCSSSA
jgi:hypothetical protein